MQYREERHIEKQKLKKKIIQYTLTQALNVTVLCFVSCMVHDEDSPAG